MRAFMLAGAPTSIRMYSEDFRIGRTLFSNGALMAEEIDVLIAKTQALRSDCAIRFTLRMSWAGKSGRAFHLEGLPVRIG